MSIALFITCIVLLVLYVSCEDKDKVPKYTYPGYAKLYDSIHDAFYFFGGLQKNDRGSPTFYNHLVRYKNGSFVDLFNATDKASENAGKLYPEGRIMANMYINDDGTKLYIGGGSNKLQTFRTQPIIVTENDGFGLSFEVSCLFNDLWEFNLHINNFTSVIKNNRSVLPNQDSKFICGAAAISINYVLMLGLSVLLYVFLN